MGESSGIEHATMKTEVGRVLSHLDREARELARELSTMEDWGVQETPSYKAAKARFFNVVNTARKMRRLPPLTEEEYERIQEEKRKR
jgi:hypothetical protein